MCWNFATWDRTKEDSVEQKNGEIQWEQSRMGLRWDQATEKDSSQEMWELKKGWESYFCDCNGDEGVKKEIRNELLRERALAEAFFFKI